MNRQRWMPWLLGLLSLLVIARWMGLAGEPESVDLVEPVQRSFGPGPAPTLERPASAAPSPNVERSATRAPASGGGQHARDQQGSAVTAIEDSAQTERFDGRAGASLFGLPPAPVKAVSAPPPPPPAAAPAPVMEAPALPRPGFAVMGVYRARGEATSLWINLGGQLILAQVGDVIDTHWRIESIDRQRVRLLHASQGISAELPIPAEVAR